MNRKRGDGESGIEGAEAVDVVHHAEEYGRRKRCVSGQSLQIVLDTYPWRSARMETGQSTILQRYVVVEPHEFHQHVADEYHEVLDVAGFVLDGHDLHRSLWRAGTLGGGTLAGG